MSAVIEVEHLAFSYPDGTEVFRDLSFKIEEGQSVGIIGPSGAGKSTLLLLLVGVLRGKGRIQVFGKDIGSSLRPCSGQALREVRKEMGLVFQNPDDQLFCPTLLEDVAFGLESLGLEPEVVKERALRALDFFGLAHLAGKSSFHLSYGEKRAASIATILALSPRILLFDEPTESLDGSLERALLLKIKSLEATKLVVTHDLLVAAELASRIMVLNGGEIIADEATETIFRKQEILRSIGIVEDYRYSLLRRFWEGND